MYEGDFFLTWDKSDDELEAVFTVADALRYMRENNISTKIFESGAFPSGHFLPPPATWGLDRIWTRAHPQKLPRRSASVTLAGP